MGDLIKALTILIKYGDPHEPTHCEHDVLQIMIDPEIVSPEDIEELAKLGVRVGDDGTFESFRFGSA